MGTIAVTMYKCQLFNEGTAVYETFIFTTIAAIAGGIAAFWAGVTVAKPLLDTYLERTGYGLAKRKVYFRGSESLIQELRENLQISNLIEPKNYSRTNVSLENADIAILCIEWQAPQDNDPKKEEKTKQWESNADKIIFDFIEEINKNTQSKDHKGLIVYTNGWFGNSTKRMINNRPFSILVNFSGRIVSDIHSLLTTLPPRNGQ
ncbi:MAG: hypothetical protein HXK10_04465 [Actinomyces sp.]|nr:hypothetical protein [Actinomyces sp.]